MDGWIPALIPLAPAFFKPFFFTMKLAPMKKLEERARTRPFMLSEDMPSRQLEPEELAIPTRTETLTALVSTHRVGGEGGGEVTRISPLEG